MTIDMFRMREAKSHVMTIERVAHNGMYIVKARSGVTLIHVMRYDNGRDAWRAFRMTPERFQSE